MTASTGASASTAGRARQGRSASISRSIGDRPPLDDGHGRAGHAAHGAPMSQHVLSTVEGAVARVTLNRLDKRNALTGEMYQALADALAQAEGDRQVRAVLLHGTAECFTSGNDLHDFLER